MKQYIKSYNIFFSGKILQILTYFVYPVLLISISAILNIFNYVGFVALLIIGIFIVVAEGFIDYNIFSGFAKKDSNRLEYMKTSVKCMTLVKKGFIADVVRRYVYSTIILLVSSLFIKVDIKSIICILAVTYLISTITIFVDRFFNNFFFNYFFVYIGVVIYSIMAFYLLNIAKFEKAIIISVIIAILSILLTCFSVWFLIKRMKEAYYDE